MESIADKIFYTIPRFSYVFRSLMKISQNFDITVSEYRIMACISVHDVKNVVKIATVLNTTQPTISKVVAHLVKNKMLEKKIDKKDKRRYDLVLTEKGKKVEKTITEQVQKLIGNMIKNVSEDDKKKIEAAMDIIEKSILINYKV